MKKYQIGLATFAFALMGQSVNAQAPQHLVTLTGITDQKFSVGVTDQEFQNIASGLSGIENLGHITVDVNSAYKDNDLPAFNDAKIVVSNLFLEAAKDLVDMRALLYKLDIDLQHNSDPAFVPVIYQAYAKKFQSRFTSLLELFVGADGSYDAALKNAMEKCFTTFCVLDISAAQKELVDFGLSINTRIDLSSTTVWQAEHLEFRSQLVKESVRRTVDEVLKTNQVQSLYQKVLRAASLPFAVAASGVSGIAESLSDFVSPRTWSRFKIVAAPISRKKKEWQGIKDEFTAVMSKNYDLIVANGKGATQYQFPGQEAESAATDSPSASGTSTSGIPAAFKSALVALDQQVRSLSKLGVVNAATGAALVSSVLSDSGKDAIGRWVLANYSKVYQDSLASGLILESSTRNLYFPKEANPLDTLNRNSCSSGSLSTMLDISFQCNKASLPFMESTPIVVYSGGSASRVIWIVPFYSQPINRFFAYVVSMNPNDYLKLNSSGDVVGVNFDPPKPVEKFYSMRQ